MILRNPFKRSVDVQLPKSETSILNTLDKIFEFVNIMQERMCVILLFNHMSWLVSSYVAAYHFIHSHHVLSLLLQNVNGFKYLIIMFLLNHALPFLHVLDPTSLQITFAMLTYCCLQSFMMLHSLSSKFICNYMYMCV